MGTFELYVTRGDGLSVLVSIFFQRDLLSGAVNAAPRVHRTARWPLVAPAQQPAMPAVGLLHGASQETFAANIAAFKQGLSQTGYIDGQNVTIEHRWANGRYDQLPALAADLVRRRVAVIATPGNAPAALAAKDATTTIPIVFGVGEDPVKMGLVASLAQPGGNATGFNFFANEIDAKRQIGRAHV